MSATKRPVCLSNVDDNAIEEIRILATTLLVAYHVIGQQDSGLQIGYPHPLRIFADILGDFRMPAFAFIAGFVYALRPPDAEKFGSFVVGKLRRIALPGVIAILVFDVVSGIFGLNWATPASHFWRLLVYPYAHFWFLQAILVLFGIVGLVDAATQHRRAIPMLVVACLITVGVALFDIPMPNVFSIGNAVGLAPFFMTGICVHRHSRWIEDHHRQFTAAALLIILCWLFWTVADYRQRGTLLIGDRHIQAMLFGTAMVMLLLFYLPHHPLARPLGRFSFTIYLYHVLGTAGTRMLLFRFGIEALSVHIIAGIAAGLLLPIAIHRLALRSPISAQIVLGIRQRRTARTMPALLPAAASSDS